MLVFPIAIPAWKLAPALAAGCTVVIKPSEVTPASMIEGLSDATQATSGARSDPLALAAPTNAAPVHAKAAKGSTPTELYLVGEVQSQVRSLARQRKRAERHTELTARQ